MTSNFSDDLKSYIEQMENLAQSHVNSVTCDDLFKNDDSYKMEKQILCDLNQSQLTTKSQGDALENLIRQLLGRVRGISQISVTCKKISIGQIDIQFLVQHDYFYEILGLISKNDQPKSKLVIGECKNLKKTQKVNLDHIEKACWRSCKGRNLQLFIGTEFTKDAIEEIMRFNEHKSQYFLNSEGVWIVPIKVSMLYEVIHENINFLFFLKWSLDLTRNNMAIANYL